jgi:dTDP-4-amino-4,6-dideoxygalactose transaminase
MADDVADFVNPVLESGYISQGPKVELLEERLKDYLGYEYGLTVNSGTSALMLALRLAGVGPGTNVVSTPMTCSATNEAIALMGADIIWADVDKWGNIDPNDVMKKINFATKAIMAVDWGGLPCSYSELRNVRDILNRPDIAIIEDAAHAFGSMYEGKDVAENGGDYVCYSFQAIKHLTTGDGGLVVVPNEETYERGKLLRWFGLDRTSSDAMRSRQDIQEVGYKFHMNDINAAIGLANLRHVNTNIEKHRDNAKYYDAYLPESVRFEWPSDRLSSFWLYTIKVQYPVKFEEWARERGAVVSQTHMRNDRYTCFSKYANRSLVGLNEFSEHMVCIPVGWWLNEGDLDWVTTLVREWAKFNK